MNNLYLTNQDLEIVRTILHHHIPDVAVAAFGSRVTGKAGKWSDLDILLLTDSPLPLVKLGDLREAFSESDLPIMVDVVDSSRIDPEFKELALLDSIIISI